MAYNPDPHMRVNILATLNAEGSPLSTVIIAHRIGKRPSVVIQALYSMRKYGYVRSSRAPGVRGFQWAPTGRPLPPVTTPPRQTRTFLEDARYSAQALLEALGMAVSPPEVVGARRHVMAE